MDLKFSLVLWCDGFLRVGFRLSHSACLCLGADSVEQKPWKRIQAACDNYKTITEGWLRNCWFLAKMQKFSWHFWHKSVFFDILRRFDWWGLAKHFEVPSSRLQLPHTTCLQGFASRTICQILKVRVPRVPRAVWRLEHLHIMLQP